MKVVNKLKDKIDDKKTKKLAKEIIRLREEIAKLEEQKMKLQAGRIPEPITEIKNNPATEKKSKKQTRKSTCGNKIKTYIQEHPQEELPKEDTEQSRTGSEEDPNKIKPGAIKKNQTKKRSYGRQGKMPTKRCNFCRKRGHIERNFPSRQICRNWLWGESNRK